MAKFLIPIALLLLIGIAGGDALARGKKIRILEEVVTVKRVEPSNDAVLNESPKFVAITFEGPVKVEESKFEITEAVFSRIIPTGNEKVTGSQRNTRIALKLPKLAPGKYRVRWKTECDCDSRALGSGNFAFTVKAKTSVN